MGQILNQGNVAVAAAPPTRLIPSSTGVALTGNPTTYQMTIDTTGQVAGSPLGSWAVEFLQNGVVVLDNTVTGALCGPYKAGSMIWFLASYVPVGADHARIRVDQCPGFGPGTGNPRLANVTITTN